MCTQPVTLRSGQVIACRECEQCKATRRSDWIGRCIAESKTYPNANVVTFSYGAEYIRNRRYLDHAGSKASLKVGASALNLHAQQLFYSDFQDLLKRWRKRNKFPLRFLCVGEYGTEKERAHWHAILWWKGDVPEHQLKTEMYHQEHWKHGFSYWDALTGASANYVVKYIRKDVDDDSAQTNFSMSRSPALGRFYFETLAARYVEQGLAPQDASYSFPEVVNSKGERYQYWLHNVSLDQFLASYVDQWRQKHGLPFGFVSASDARRHLPSSPFLEEWLDRRARKDSGRPANRHPSDPYYREEYAVPIRKPDKPGRPAPGADSFFFSKPHNAFCSMVGGQRLFWTFDDEGQRAWRSVIIPESAAAVRRLELQKQRASVASPDVYRRIKSGD